jgi:cobyrinic acid a,c-diamide synthase
MLRDALSPLGIPVVGALPRDDALRWRDRHLGLVPVAEQPEMVRGSLQRLADIVRTHIDLEGVVALARSAPERPARPVPLPAAGPQIRVAVAGGSAFTFTYTDTLDALQAAGAEIVPFDPLGHGELPEAIDGLLIGGGFPEVHAAALSANRPLLDQIHRVVRDGLPAWAECGGLLLLGESLDGHPMAGVVAGHAVMTERLSLGYRQAVTAVASPIGPAGTLCRGHEFHYSTMSPPGEALLLSSRWGQRTDGWATPTLLATYLHHHPGGDPGAIAAFASTCALRRTLRPA